MTLNDYIITNKPFISLKLKSFFAEKKTIFSYDPEATELLHRLEIFTSRGKMLRPLLVLLGYEMAGGKRIDDVLDIAVAMELTQAGALIHDDIMDQDELRRGEKTISAQYTEIAKEKRIPNSLFFGQGMGICAGDICFFLAFEALSTGLKGEGSHISDSFTWYTYAFERCIFAQMLDFRLGMTQDNTNSEQILSLYLNKTAYYSIVLPLLLGAHKAGASESLCNTLEKLGKSIGVIFQIIDDEIGFLGKSTEIGKPEGSDIRENKKTLIRQLIFEHTPEKEKGFLEQCFGNNTLSTEQLELLRQYYTKYEIKHHIDAIITPFVTEATSLLEALPDGTPKNILSEFLQYNLKRTV